MRVRVGYAMQNWLMYGTGGVAVVSGKTNASITAGPACGTINALPCSGDVTRVGIAAGGGSNTASPRIGAQSLNISGSVPR